MLNQFPQKKKRWSEFFLFDNKSLFWVKKVARNLENHVKLNKCEEERGTCSVIQKRFYKV